MICPRCGADLPEGMRYCVECGATIEVKKQSPAESINRKRKAWPIVLTFFLILAASVICAMLFIPELHDIVFGVEDLAFAESKYEICLGEKLDLTNELDAGKQDKSSLKWLSDDKDVAEVKNGVVTAVGTGKCHIKVTYFNHDDVYDEVRVTVVSGDSNVSNVSADNGGAGGKADAPWNTMTDGDYQVSIRRLNPYSGPFLEDGQDKEVTNVLALQFRNDSEQDIQYAEYVFEVNGEEIPFKLSCIPAGQSCVVLAANRHAYNADEVLKLKRRLVNHVDYLPTADEQLLLVNNADDSISVLNLTDQLIPVARVYYKTYYAEEDTFIGGITYSIEIRNIPAGGSSEALTPSHFSSAMSRFVGSGVYDS